MASRIDINEKLLKDTIEKLDKRITRLTSRLKVDGNGHLLSDSISLNSAISMRKDIAKEFGPYYKDAATATDYRPAQKEAGKVLKKAGIDVGFTKADTSLVKAFSDDGLNQLTGLGNQYSSQISQKVYAAVAAGHDIDDLTTEISQLLKGGTDKAGRPMVNHAQTIASTGYMEVDSIMLDRKTEGIEGIKFKYAGSLINDSREWCVKEIGKAASGKTYTKEEINQIWGSAKWQGKKAGNPFTVRGGWNCRHRWLPILA